MRTRRRVQQFEEDEDEDGEEEEEDDDPYAQFNLKRLHQKTNSPPPSEEVENYVKLGMGVSGLVLVRQFQLFTYLYVAGPSALRHLIFQPTNKYYFPPSDRRTLFATHLWCYGGPARCLQPTA